MPEQILLSVTMDELRYIASAGGPCDVGAALRKKAKRVLAFRKGGRLTLLERCVKDMEINIVDETLCIGSDDDEMCRDKDGMTADTWCPAFNSHDGSCMLDAKKVGN